MSVAIENFIKTIYQSQKHYDKDTKPGNIAKKLGITNAAATDMAKKLSERELLHYQKYQQLELTDKGNKMAVNVIRKHRLWEALLFKLFDMSLHEIHHEAELLEHATSDFLTDKIYQYLGQPKFDPHGEPIPDAAGKYPKHQMPLVLSEAPEMQKYNISKLVSADKAFFDFCTENGLLSGAEIFVQKQYENPRMTQILANDSKLLLHQDFTNVIYVI